jgi:vitamin B12 transporter
MSGSVSGRKVAATSFFALAVLSPAFAADPDLVITPNRTETPISRAGSAVTIITGEEIERMRGQSFVDVLRNVPGLDIYQNGGFGSQATVSLRGARDGQTLVMIDGIRAGDPSSTAGAVDLGQLALHNIDRIEILRGPQSALYGSDAMGGVINIITKKGQGEPKTTVSMEAGSYGTLRSTGSVTGRSGDTSYSLSIDGVTSESFPPFGYRIKRPIEAYNFVNYSTSNVTNIPRHAPARKGGVSGTISYDLDTTTRIDLGLRADGDWLRLSNPGASSAALIYDHYNKSASTFAQGFARLTNDLFDGRLRNKLMVYSNVTDRSIQGIEYCADSTYTTYWNCQLGYRGTRTGADYQGDVKSEAFGLTSFGLHHETETIATTQSPDLTNSFTPLEKSQATNSIFVQQQRTFFDRLHVSVGGRVDAVQQGETFPTWRVTAAYTLTDDTKLRASAGTGARAPSLFERFSTYGAPGLLPEKSRGYDMGVDHMIGRDTKLSASLFYTSYENLIEWNSNIANCHSNCYYNIANATTRGVELSGQTILIDNLLKGRFGYTLMESEKKNPSEPLLRRPRNRTSLTLTYIGIPRLEVDGRITFVSRAIDKDFNSATYPTPVVALDSYLKLDAIANYKIDQNKSAFLRAENLTNVRYEELYNYGTAGRSFYAGLRVNW